MDDPFDAVTPIGPPKRVKEEFASRSLRPASHLSQRERTLRRQRNKSNQETGQQSSHADLKPLGKGRGLLTQARALTMVSRLSEDFFVNARDVKRADSHRKHASTSLAIMLDKWLLLSGRPTQILGFADVDAQRAGALELARRLALSAGEERSA